jgi:hypothetical protein
MAETENQPIKASQLDKVFDIALVLLGVLAAAELQYISSVEMATDTDLLFTFRLTTSPFVILILAWICKEVIVKLIRRLKLRMILTLFSWAFWSNTLFVFMYLFISFSERSQPSEFYNVVLWSLFGGTLILGFLIDLAYYKSDPGVFSDEFREKRGWFWAEAFATLGLAFAFITFIISWSFSAYLGGLTIAQVLVG